VTPDRSADHNGWYNHSIDFTTSGSDGTGSGIDSCDALQNYVAPDGTGLTVSGSCTDNAGNVGSADSAAFKLDDTNPSVSVTPDRSADHNGWYNHSIDFTTSGSDGTGSGIDSCDALQNYAAPDGTGLTVSGSCTDNAGNVGSADSAAFKLDDTNPSVTVTPARVPDVGTWYNAAVVFDTAGTDATSGVSDANCTANYNYTAPDGTGLTRNGSCTDNAGNVGNGTSAAFDFDDTNPSISIIAPANAGSYILNAAVASSYSCTDVTSGLASCVGPVASGANFSTSPVGGHSFTVNATDVAGNPASLTNSYSVIFASGGTCLGAPGHSILQPINADGSSVWKARNVVPVKFRVCDANWQSVGGSISAVFDLSGGKQAVPYLYKTTSGVLSLDETAVSNTPDPQFRWSATDSQWIFNLNTTNLSAGKTYFYHIYLADGTTIDFQFGLK
jgi:hypothetical protein